MLGGTNCVQIVSAGIIAASNRIIETSLLKEILLFFSKLYYSRSKDLCYHKENNKEKSSDKLRNSNKNT